MFEEFYILFKYMNGRKYTPLYKKTQNKTRTGQWRLLKAVENHTCHFCSDSCFLLFYAQTKQEMYNITKHAQPEN